MLYVIENLRILTASNKQDLCTAQTTSKIYGNLSVKYSTRFS